MSISSDQNFSSVSELLLGSENETDVEGQNQKEQKKNRKEAEEKRKKMGIGEVRCKEKNNWKRTMRRRR